MKKSPNKCRASLANSPIKAGAPDACNDDAATAVCRSNVRQSRATYDAFLGQGGHGADVSWNTRRRIMGALRKSCRVLGVGQKSRIGRLGGGAAIGAIIVGFATPSLAQYAAGGGTANDSQSTAVGSGAVAGQAGTQTLDTNGDGLPDLTLNQDTAIGAGTSATGGFATAIGNGVSAQGLYASAMGSNSTATGNGAVSIGRSNTVDSYGVGTTMVAQGVLNRATGAGNAALGNGTTDVTAAGIGIGTNNSVDGAGVAVGSGNLVNNTGSSGFAFGNANAATGAYSTAIGMGNSASVVSTIAIGTVATASGNTAISIGRQTIASGQTSIALGNVSTANQTNTIAVGHSARATAQGAIALGGGLNAASTNLDTTAAAASGTNSIAFGTNATANAASAIAVGLTSASSGVDGVSIGTGSKSWDGSVAIGSGASADHLSTAVADGSVAIGPNATVGNATERGIALGAGAQVTGFTNDGIAIGSGATSSGTSSIALGDGAIASGPQSISIGTGNVVSGANSGAFGDPNTITGTGSYAFGNNNNIAADNAFAIGNNIVISAGQNGSVGIGDGTTVTGPNTGLYSLNGGTVAAVSPTAVLSVGATGSERQITNVAAGVISAASTDAVNGSQLFTVATATNNLGNSLETVTGGGLVINANGTIATNPSITAAGSTFTNVTSAIQALNTANTVANDGFALALGAGSTVAADGTFTAPTYAVAGSTYDNVGDALGALDAGSLVQQVGGAPGTGQITVAAATGGTSLNIAGTSGDRTLSGVLAGSLTAVSTDAVNGAQVNALASSIAANTGGGSVFDPVTGAVTAPTVNVGGTAYTDLSSAIEAAGAGFSLTTTAAGTGVANTSTLETIAAGETVTLTAGNNIVTTQTGNATQIALNPVLSGLTSIGIAGGPSMDASGIAMNGAVITGLAAGSTTSASTDAINGGQLNIALASVATDLGGGATYNPVTGLVNAPGYAIDGATYNNVGDALAALAAESKYADFNSALAAANASGVNASAIGPNAQAAGNNAAAFGMNSDANGTNSVALGSGAVSTGNNSVALGANSLAGAANGGWAGITIAGVIQSNNVTGNAVVSVSGGSINRQITGIADGAVNATSTDAVSGSQLFGAATALDTKASNIGAGVADAIGGGAIVAANGVVTAPIIDVNGAVFSNLTDAIEAAAAGFDLTIAAAGSGVANGSSLAGIGSGDSVILSAGNNIVATQSGNDVAFALTTNLTGIDSVAINGGPTINGAGITLNAGDAFDAGGNALVNVGAGLLAAGSTEAVNGSQLFAALQGTAGATNALGISVAANLGGTAVYDPSTDTVSGLLINVGASGYATVTDAFVATDIKADTGLGDVASAFGGGATYDPATGALTAPAYSVAGSTFGNAGDAFAAVDTQLSSLANGTAGLVQQIGGAPGTGDITIGAATGGLSVDFAGTQGARTVTGIQAGSLSATSSDAANGSQINILASSIASNTGGGAIFDPLSGVISAPTITVGGTGYGNIAAAIEAGDTKANLANAGLASAIGGGAFVGLDGAVTTPLVTVGGTAYSNLADAISAAGSGFTLTTAATGTGTASGTSLAAIAAGDSVTLTAGNNISVAQTDGNVAISLANDLTGLNSIGVATINAGSVVADSLTINGGPVLDGTGLALAAGNAFDAGGNVLGNVGAGSLTAGSTDAVNGSQLLAATQESAGATDALGNSVAANLGGTAVYDPATDTVTGLAISVGAASFDNVTDAFAATEVKVDLANAGLADALGGGATYDPATGQISAPSFAIAGSTFDNAGDAFGAVDAQLASLANGASGLVQQVGSAPGTGEITIGAETGGTSVNIAGINGERTISGLRDGDLSTGSTEAVTGNQINTAGTSVANAIGGGSTFNPATGQVSAPAIIVGGTSYDNITDAVQASDAKTSNLGSGMAAALGGGAAVAPDGTVTAPAFTVQSVTSDNVGDALASVDSSLTGLTGAVSNLTNGTSGIVQQGGGAPGTGQISVGAATGGNSINVAGTQGNRTITGVAAGSVNAASTDAVNGSQLFAVQQVANGALQTTGGALTGQLSLGGNRITDVAAPITGTDAANRNYVDSVAASAAATSANIGANTANHLGGGSAFDPATGQVSAPSYTVGGQAYGNVGAAIAATNMLAVQYVANASGQPTNAIRLGTSAGAPPVALGNVAAGTVTAASTDAVNGGQLYAVQTVANGALQRTGGTVSGNINMAGNRVTGLAAPIDASDAATRGYVDALQSQNANNFNLLTSGLNNAFKGIEKNSQGVALAIAMGGGFLSDDKDFSLWGAWGNFDGNNAASLQTYIRLDDDTYINAGLSYGFEQRLVGTRVGLGIQF